MKHLLFVWCFLLTLSICLGRSGTLPTVSDVKEFQRLLKLRTNVLVVATKSASDIPRDLMTTLEDVEKEMKGVADIVTVDCSNAKKVCKKFKFHPSKLDVLHFMNGQFHKQYDRALKTKSLINFLKAPQDEAPWSEDPGTKDIIHIDEAKDLMTIFKRESKRPILLMFYTPWCHHCKAFKPEFASAASMMKKEVVFIGIDCQKAENYPLQQGFNVSGYPTVLLMRNGDLAGRYVGEHTRSDLIDWLQHPEKQQVNPEPKAPPAEEPWAEQVEMLSTDSFESYLADNPSVLVMFYAPWCGHCKRLKPEYEQAAISFVDGENKNTVGRLAAVDATKETALGQRFKIAGYPTLKYFADGEFKFDVHFRSQDEIVKFMLDPKEPPVQEEKSDGWETDPEVVGPDGKSPVDFLDDDNFSSFMKKKKHGLVMFYAPWCGHCKAAKPHYAKAAKTFEAAPKVSFAAVDCTRSTVVCKDQDVRGFPTIKYFSYGKNPQPYEGQRDTDAFVNFMKAQAGGTVKTEL